MNRMKKLFTLLTLLLWTLVACSNDSAADEKPGSGGTDIPVGNLPMQNVARAIELIDNAVECYFTGTGMAMSRYYNPYTGNRSSELGSVWMYTSSIEAVNAAMKAMKTGQAKGETALYDSHFNRYKELLTQLYDNLEYYAGTFTLTSYTQTRQWTVYGVDRGSDKGAAQVEGVLNVYDDQMWLIRELLESYHITGEQRYLDKAEYLAEYVLDGWDCTLDEQGRQLGGITWGPGYLSKHSCSNGPMVSPLVWLHEIYKGKSDEVTYGFVDTDISRKLRTEKKADYYLNFAKVIYDWQKAHLLRPDGVYDDMMGGAESPEIEYVTIDGLRYRKGTKLRDRVGPAITYNSGTMLSGAADLYRATSDAAYRTDLAALTDKSFVYFAKEDASKPGCYAFDISGFRNWFNGVLMRGYVDASAAHTAASGCIAAFQHNLDYAYDNYLYKQMLPTNLLVGWNKAEKSKNNVEAMFTFAFAAEYAVLANYEWSKN